MSEQSTIWSKLKSFMGGTVINTINEIHTLMPDSILFGSLLLYFLTQNMSFGIFAIFVFEMAVSHKLISWISSQSIGTSRSADLSCRMGYKTPQFNPQRMFLNNEYPSYSVFSIVSIATYLALSTNEFKDTMDTMGAEWSSRYKVAYTFIGLVVGVVILTRLWTCDKLGDVIFALISATVIGAVFFIINKSLFGEEGINFLGLPYLVSKESKGSPIYVCSAEA
jgi:hypothetical protein